MARNEAKAGEGFRFWASLCARSPQPINSGFSRLCPGKLPHQSLVPFRRSGAADRADQPSYRSGRDPAGRPEAARPRKGQRGPNAGIATHREDGEGPRGSEARTGAARSGGERDWSTARRAKPGRMRASAPPGVPDEARAIVGATSPRPTDKQNEGTKQAGKPSPAPGEERAEGGGRRRPGEADGWGGPSQLTISERPGGARPCEVLRNHPAYGGRASPGRSMRAGQVSFRTPYRECDIHTLHCPARRRARHSRYSPEFDRYTPDRCPRQR